MVALSSGTYGRKLSAAHGLRAALFALLAAFILLGPALPQMLSVHSVLLRPWIMYSEVGVGILKGRFIVAVRGGERSEMTPLGLLGLKSYPVQRHYEFDRRVFEARDLSGFAADLCPTLPERATLSFDGIVGTRAGWKPLAVDDVCALETGEEAAASQPRRRIRSESRG